MDGDRAKKLFRIPPGVPSNVALNVCGGVGLTAYFGLLKIGAPLIEGSVVVVSGAAGATGMVAGQIAKLKGAKVIGIAGGPSKVKFLLENLHFDAAIDYKSENVAKRLLELAPKGIDIYFDNVGGVILDAALNNLALHARVVACGSISGYNGDVQGVSNLSRLVTQRAKMEGFIVSDFSNEFPEALKDLGTWLKEGKIKSVEDIQHGWENIPKTLLRIFHGENLGKQLLKL